MSTVAPSSFTREQVTAWLRGLLTIAWADGNLDPEEQKLIAALAEDEQTSASEIATLQIISPRELAAVLGHDPAIAENFLRTAVLVALADGTYSFCEDELLYQFCVALEQKVELIEALRTTALPVGMDHTQVSNVSGRTLTYSTEIDDPLNPELYLSNQHTDVLNPVRDWLDKLEIHDAKVATFLCKMIPAQCPFERDIVVMGRKVAHIPPLCKLNPLYDQMVGLRFRALSYLADECGEDVSQYC